MFGYVRFLILLIARKTSVIFEKTKKIVKKAYKVQKNGLRKRKNTNICVDFCRNDDIINI